MEANNQKQADVIDCQQNGYKGLKGAVIKERYKIIKPLSEGACGYIYYTEDSKAEKDGKIKAIKV